MRGVDATVLTLLLNENADSPPDPTTKKPVEKTRDRVNFLVETLQKQQQKIVIPTPVLAEVLVRTGEAGLRYVEVLQKAAVFEIRDFDKLAAIELALMTRHALEAGKGKKKSGSDEPWQKIKLDRQIVAVCKVAGVSTIYASDKSLRNFAQLAGMQVIGVHQLPLPPTPPQLSMHDLLEKKPEEDKTDQPSGEPDEDAES
jgi:predicted nucleic acid-binding protein